MANQGHTERDLLSCSICLDLLRNPKTLSCMHRYCESCLDNYITSAARTSHFTRGFSCPECREFILVPISSTPPTFKTDFHMNSLIELYESRQEMNVPAISQPCPSHGKKELELYCFDCSASVCYLCAVISHRGCHKIGTLKEAALERRTRWQEQLNQTYSVINEALQLEELRERCEKQANKRKERAENEIRESAKKMRQIVTNKEEKLVERLHGKYGDLEQTVRLNVFKFNEHVNKLGDLGKNVSSKITSLSDSDLMLENDVSDGIDSCRKQNVVVNEDYRRFCESLSVVKFRFNPHNIPRASLGDTEFMCNATSKNGSNFPMPSSWQHLVSTGTQLSKKSKLQH